MCATSTPIQDLCLSDFVNVCTASNKLGGGEAWEQASAASASQLLCTLHFGHFWTVLSRQQHNLHVKIYLYYGE